MTSQLVSRALFHVYSALHIVVILLWTQFLRGGRVQWYNIEFQQMRGSLVPTSIAKDCKLKMSHCSSLLVSGTFWNCHVVYQECGLNSHFMLFRMHPNHPSSEIVHIVALATVTKLPGTKPLNLVGCYSPWQRSPWLVKEGISTYSGHFYTEMVRKCKRKCN